VGCPEVKPDTAKIAPPDPIDLGGWGAGSEMREIG
jgi:hypothetical protein|tara:strand:- start:1479 stop:1583 length:105 start_codon:yes stop_codon:yes gene_type:complete